MQHDHLISTLMAVHHAVCTGQAVTDDVAPKHDDFFGDLTQDLTLAL